MLTRRLAAELTAVALIGALTVGAFARSHHKHKHHRIHHHRVVHHVKKPHAPPVPYYGFSGSSLVNAMARDLGSNPTGWAHVWCGFYLGQVAQRVGYRPPPGYYAARNWVRFGVPTGPEAGAVMVFPHHVGVIVRNLGNGLVVLRSGNHGHRVADGVYPVRRAIAFRRPA